MNLPFLYPLVQFPASFKLSFKCSSMNSPCLTSICHTPSWIQFFFLLKYLPGPFFLFSVIIPSKVSPFPQMIFPLPVILSLRNQPQQSSLAFYICIFPMPSFLFLTNYPSYSSPFPYDNTPLPQKWPSLNCPLYVLSLNLKVPLPCFQFQTKSPSYVAPDASWKIPLPCFFPQTKSPVYSVPSFNILNLPIPWNSSFSNYPSYYRTPFKVQTPFPCFIPFLKVPLQVVPSFFSRVPSNSSLSLNSPVNFYPSAQMNSQFQPHFWLCFICPVYFDLSEYVMVPLMNSPSQNYPSKVPFFYFHTPLPWGLNLLKQPSYESPFGYLNLPKEGLPLSKTPSKTDPSLQNISPFPSGLPSSSTSPLQPPLSLGYSFSQGTVPWHRFCPI